MRSLFIKPACLHNAEARAKQEQNLVKRTPEHDQSRKSELDFQFRVTSFDAAPLNGHISNEEVRLSLFSVKR